MHGNAAKKDWKSIPEDSLDQAEEEGEFDYDLSDLLIDE